MISRRGIVGMGIAFCGCALTGRAVSAPREPLRVNGRRVRTIDVHAHCLVPEALGLLNPTQREEALALVRGPIREQMTLGPAGSNLAQRLSAMDAQGVDLEVLSINPFWYGLDRETASAIVRLQNDKLAELSAAHPERFAAVASLPLQYPDLAVTELERAVTLGLKGAAIGGHVLGTPFSDARFHPVWAKAEALNAVLFIHPSGLRSPELDRHLAGNGVLNNAISNPLETTITLSHLIFEGTLDRFPGLKVCSAHGGGYLPSYAGRSDNVCRSSQRCDPNIKLAKSPSAYLRDMYYDSLVFTPEGLRHLVAEVGASRVMLGTDTPYPWQAEPVAHVLATTSLTTLQKIGILGENAAQLLRL